MGRFDTAGQFHCPSSFIKEELSSGMRPFNSKPAGSLHSSLHGNYSLGELKECGTLSRKTAEHHIHSLAIQRGEEAAE